MNKEEKALVRIIWDYMNIKDKLEKCDCILCFGNSNLEIARHGARLFLDGYADWIIFTGGFGKITGRIWDEPEADKFAKIAIEMGVPKEKILIENKSTNTGQNVEFAKKILKEKHLDFKSFIIVADPMSERRAYATAMVWLGDRKLLLSAPETNFEEYIEKKMETEKSKMYMISNYVGDIQRMKVFADKGWQIPQEIPEHVEKSALKLLELGYDKFIYKD